MATMVPITCVLHETPIGPLTLSANEHGLTRIRFGLVPSDQPYSETPQFPLLIQALQELREYFAGTRRSFEVPLAASGSDFQLRVWAALCQIPYGQTYSYGEIADAIGQPGAARAVGMANNKNPLPIMVPCHRVIGGNGKLVGFNGGLTLKQQLLALEQPQSQLFS